MSGDTPPFATFSSAACWKLTRHLEEFINGEAVKGDRADEAACNWAAESLKQLWERIGQCADEEHCRKTRVAQQLGDQAFFDSNPPEHVSGPVGRVLDGISVDAEGKVA